MTEEIAEEEMTQKEIDQLVEELTKEFGKEYVEFLEQYKRN